MHSSQKQPKLPQRVSQALDREIDLILNSIDRGSAIRSLKKAREHFYRGEEGIARSIAESHGFALVRHSENSFKLTSLTSLPSERLSHLI